MDRLLSEAPRGTADPESGGPTTRRRTGRSARPATLVPAAALAVGALVLAACGGGTTGSATSSTAATRGSGSSSSSTAPSSPVVMTASAGSLGTILVDTSGRTLYRFDHDTATTSACTGSCSSLWPALTVPAGRTPTGRGVSGLSFIMLADGSHQVSYQGHPLYTFAGDQAAGQTKGNGFGGVWHVVQVSTTSSGGSTGSTGTTPTTSAPSSSSGY